MRHVAQTHSQPERQHRDAAVQQCDRAGARVGVATVRDLPCEFRKPADGLHRHRPGAFGNSGDDAARGPGAGQSVRRQDDQQLAQPVWHFRSPRWERTGTRYAMPTTVRGGKSSTCRWCGRSGLATVTASRRASKRSMRSTGSCLRTRTRRCRLRPSGALPPRGIRGSCSLR